MGKDYQRMALMYGVPETDFHQINAADERLKEMVMIDNCSSKKITVAAAIIVHGGCILAAERGYGEWKGWWEFPGGKVEQGETPEQALRREIREEMDTDINIVRFYRTIEYSYPKFDMTMFLYLCKLPSGQYTLKEHSDARLLTQDQLNSVRWLPADIELIKEWEKQMVTLD